MKILMIEDDKTTVEVVRLTLECHDPNSKITSKEKGREGLETARNENFDVVVLDLGLPDIDGLKVLKELREFSEMPVLVVSARHDATVITNALSLGAQDYILKPFKFQSFFTSLKDVAGPPADQDPNVCRRMTDAVTLCDKSHEAFVNDQRVELSEEEWKVLNRLIEHCGRIVPTKALAEILSSEKFVGESAVNLIINQLRKKLGDDPYIPKLIISEYECGYRFIKQTISANPAGAPRIKIL